MDLVRRRLLDQQLPVTFRWLSLSGSGMPCNTAKQLLAHFIRTESESISDFHVAYFLSGRLASSGQHVARLVVLRAGETLDAQLEEAKARFDPLVSVYVHGVVPAREVPVKSGKEEADEDDDGDTVMSNPGDALTAVDRSLLAELYEQDDVMASNALRDASATGLIRHADVSRTPPKKLGPQPKRKAPSRSRSTSSLSKPKPTQTKKQKLNPLKRAFSMGASDKKSAKPSAGPSKEKKKKGISSFFGAASSSKKKPAPAPKKRTVVVASDSESDDDVDDDGDEPMEAASPKSKKRSVGVAKSVGSPKKRQKSEPKALDKSIYDADDESDGEDGDAAPAMDAEEVQTKLAARRVSRVVARGKNKGKKRRMKSKVLVDDSDSDESEEEGEGEGEGEVEEAEQESHHWSESDSEQDADEEPQTKALEAYGYTPTDKITKKKKKKVIRTVVDDEGFLVTEEVEEVDEVQVPVPPAVSPAKIQAKKRAAAKKKKKLFTDGLEDMSSDSEADSDADENVKGKKRKTKKQQQKKPKKGKAKSKVQSNGILNFFKRA